MGKDVIVALDFPSKQRVMEFLDLFQEEKPYVKIGMEQSLFVIDFSIFFHSNPLNLF